MASLISANISRRRAPQPDPPARPTPDETFEFDPPPGTAGGILKFLAWIMLWSCLSGLLIFCVFLYIGSLCIRPLPNSPDVFDSKTYNLPDFETFHKIETRWIDMAEVSMNSITAIERLKSGEALVEGAIGIVAASPLTAK
jgi:hypothetical protein